MDEAPISHRARRIEFQEEENPVNIEADGSGSGDEQEPAVEQEDGVPLLLLILLPTGGLLLLCIPFCIALRSKACLCRQCC